MVGFQKYCENKRIFPFNNKPCFEWTLAHQGWWVSERVLPLNRMECQLHSTFHFHWNVLDGGNLCGKFSWYWWILFFPLNFFQTDCDSLRKIFVNKVHLMNMLLESCFAWQVRRITVQNITDCQNSFWWKFLRTIFTFKFELICGYFICYPEAPQVL